MPDFNGFAGLFELVSVEKAASVRRSDRIFRGLRLFRTVEASGYLQCRWNLPVMCVLRSWIPAVGLLLSGTVFVSGSVYGQQSAAGASGRSAQQVQDDRALQVQRLVQDLGADAFAVRQRASAELLRLEETAWPALSQARATATGEVAVRLQQLQQRLTARWFQARLQRLQADADAAVMAADWPDWPRFLVLTGGSDAEPQQAMLLRGLFLQIVQSETELFAARVFDPAALPGLLEVRGQRFAESCDGREDRPFSTGSGLALMLLASDASVRLVRATSAHISRALEDPRFNKLVEDGVHSGSVRGVVSGWLLRPGISADRPLLFAMQHRLPAGRELAVRILNGNLRGPQLYYACMCLAVLESRQDLSLLESKFTSESLIWPVRGAVLGERPSGFQVQLGDAALAAAFVLRGGQPQDAGIPAERSSVMLFRMETLGSVSAEERVERLRKYRLKYPE